MHRELVLLLALGTACPPAADTSAPADSETDPHTVCGTETVLLDRAGNPTGFVDCGAGGVDRVGSWSGDVDAYAADWGDTTASWLPEGGCHAHADCRANERCVISDWCMTVDTECVEVCASDADCATGRVCVPPDVHDGWITWPTCVPANCATGADCPSGECGLMTAGSRGTVGLACRTTQDDCREHWDCRNADGLYCLGWEDGWSCQDDWDCD